MAEGYLSFANSGKISPNLVTSDVCHFQMQDFG